MDRFRLAKIVRWVLHLHYDVRLSGVECMYDGCVHLVLPNHPAYIDPLILFSECSEVPLCPMVDERFFRNALFRRVLRMANAVLVPDLEKTHDRVNGVAQAKHLTDIAVTSLQEGRDMVFYPSGHVKLTDCEIIGNRRLAYEVIQQLPDNVEVVMVCTRGLESSRWSKLRPKKWHWRRRVRMHFAVMTDQLKSWATEDKRSFNAHLEEWYNQMSATLEAQ